MTTTEQQNVHCHYTPAPAKKPHRFRNFVVFPVVGLIALVAILSAASGGSKSISAKPTWAMANPAKMAMRITVSIAVVAFAIQSLRGLAREGCRRTAIVLPSGRGRSMSRPRLAGSPNSVAFRCHPLLLGGFYGRSR